MYYNYYNDELYHFGRKGMKWGQHIFGKPESSGTVRVKKTKRYLDDDGALTSAGRKQLRKLNDLDQKDNYDRMNRRLAERNVDKFSEGKNIVSKSLAKINQKHVSNFDEVIKQNDEQIKKIIGGLKDQKVDVVLRYDPYFDRMYYKQSDAQQVQAKDSKLYRKEGIKITRDDQGRIASVKAENADVKAIKRVNDIARRGYY